MNSSPASATASGSGLDPHIYLVSPATVPGSGAQGAYLFGGILSPVGDGGEGEISTVVPPFHLFWTVTLLFKSP